jgi:hypothetical protein
LIDIPCPAIVTPPDLGLVLVFCEKVAVTEPAAVPPEEERPIQVGSLTDADHEPPVQPLGLALMVNCMELPLAGTVGTDAGVAENVQVPDDTIRTAATNSGLFDAEGALIRRLQPYEPIANPAVFGVAVMIPGVVPPEDTESQEHVDPEVGISETLYGSEPPVLVTEAP